MATIKEIIHARISELEAEIAECKRALAAMDTPKIEYIGGHTIKLGESGGGGTIGMAAKQTLADIIKEMLNDGPMSRNDIAGAMQHYRDGTTPQTISGTLNGMSKAGVVKLKNKKWSLK